MHKCICKGNVKGNWSSIVKDTESLLGKVFVNDKGDKYRLFGVVHGAEDYYYGLSGVETGKILLLSCVAGLETFGLEVLDN